MYKLTEYEKQKIREGEAAIAAGQVISLEEVEAKFKEKFRVAKLKAKKGGIRARTIRRPVVFAGR